MKIRSNIRTVAALALAAVMLLLCACNDAETPEQAIKRFNKRMNDCSYKAAFDYVKEYDGLSFDSGDRSGTRKIVDAVSKTLEIEIVDIQTSGANGSAVLNITTVDLREIYSRAASTVTNNYVDTVLKGSRISATTRLFPILTSSRCPPRKPRNRAAASHSTTDFSIRPAGRSFSAAKGME